MVNSFGNQKVSSYICKNYQEESLMCKFEEIEGWRLSYGKTIREIKNAVHEEVNLGRIYLIISILFAYMGTVSMQAQSCEGRVYLKNGIQQLYESNDRIDLPRKKKDVQVYRNFFSRQCTSDVIPFANIDSVVVWNATSKQNVRTLVPLENVGWSWLYINHPRLQVYIYASQGYSVTDMGGMKAWQGNTVAALFLIPSKTACDFYVRQTDGKLICLGDTYKKCDKSFIRELCHCVGLSQEWEKKLIGLGEHNRSSMIQRVIEVLDDKQ